MNNCIRAGLKVSDFTFSTRATTVPTVVRSRQAIARRGQILSYFYHELVSTSSIKMTSYNERWCAFLNELEQLGMILIFLIENLFLNNFYYSNQEKRWSMMERLKTQMLALRQFINHPEPQALLIWGQKCLLFGFIWESLEIVPITRQNIVGT